jgi:hypothetical protein
MTTSYSLSRCTDAFGVEAVSPPSKGILAHFLRECQM